MIQPILHAPDPRLKKVAASVCDFGIHLESQVNDMAQTMYGAKGIGLAAPQLGWGQRIVVIDLSSPSSLRPHLQVFVNPVLSKGRGQATIEEGCLSVPGKLARPPRFERVEVQAQDVKGRPFRLKATGLLAICLQHEVDHLNGVLMTDPEAGLGA